MLKERRDKEKGLLCPGPDGAIVRRYLPSERFAAFVEHYWIARWRLLDGSSYLAELTYPSTHLVVEGHAAGGVAYVAGVITGKFTKHLQGEGQVLGIKFRPGGFYPVARTAVATFTDRQVPLRQLFGIAAIRLEREVWETRDDATLVALAEGFLGGILPAGDVTIPLATEIVDWIDHHRAITKVDDVAVRFGLNRRALQRLFHRHVGVPPKWVINRLRLLEAVEALPSHKDGEVGLLAANLGYFDQSHFGKDFRNAVGTTPADYARRSSRA